MINKGMVNKGKYWIFEKNKGAPVSYFKYLKGTCKGIQYSISFKFELSCYFVDKMQLKMLKACKLQLSSMEKFWAKGISVLKNRF